jgi:hypothetical protein
MGDSACEEQPIEEALVVHERFVWRAGFDPSPSCIELARAVERQTYQKIVRFGFGAIPDCGLSEHG